MKPVVRTGGLGFRYPRSGWTLQEVELELTPSERVALIGPNGAGKTTLIRLLATDLQPTAGKLFVLDRPASSPTSELRRLVAYGPDRPVHLEPLTGAQNLRFFRELRGEGPRDGRADPFGLDRKLQDPVSSYSFGMRRKLLLTEVLSGQAPLIVLDEPLVGLDPEGVGVLGRLLAERAAQGATVVFATNEIRDVPVWASRVLFLHQGRVVADGTPSELLRRVRERTTIVVTTVGALPDPDGFIGRVRETVPGVERVRVVGKAAAGSTRVRVTTPDGGAILPALLGCVLGWGARVRDVQVRDPDLRDVFREVTGAELEPPEAEKNA